MLPLTADDSFDIYKPLSSDDHSGTQKKPEEPSDSFDTSKNFGTCKSTVSNVSGIRKSGSSSSSQKVSIDRTSSNSSDTSPASDSFDTYKTREGASAFDNYKPIGVGDSGNFDVSTPSSSFDIYKPTSIGDDGFDNYKPGSAQSSSFDANSGSLPFIGFEQRKACRASSFDIFTWFGQVTLFRISETGN